MTLQIFIAMMIINVSELMNSNLNKYLTLIISSEKVDLEGEKDWDRWNSSDIDLFV